MSERYFGKVVHITDKFSVVINAGSEREVKAGMKFLVVGLGDLIRDPDTGEELEQLEIVRGRAEVVHVQSKLSTLKSIEVDRQPDTRELNNHQLKAGGLEIGGLNPRLKEKAAESRWFGPRAERPSGGLKPPYGNQESHISQLWHCGANWTARCSH